MVGKGQPPKAPEEKKERTVIYVSEMQKEIIEKAREIEAPEKRYGAYLRDSAIAHAEDVINNNKK